MMGTKINSFLQNFQDMFVVKVNTLKSFPNSLSQVELALIDQQLSNICERLSSLIVLTGEASEENLQEYRKIIQVLTDKLDYLENLSDMLLYINSNYDLNNLLDIKHYDLNQPITQTGLIFDNTLKGTTLRGVSNTHSCPRQLNIEDGMLLTYYNTNLSYHSSLVLDSEYLDILDIQSIIITKADGTSLKFPYVKGNKTSFLLRHDLLTSTQIQLHLNVNIYSLPVRVQEYYLSLKVSLLDYEYQPQGFMHLEGYKYNCKRIFNYLYDVDLPSNCFINNCLDIDLLDINGMIINKLSMTLPLGSTQVCKQLDQIDFREVESIVGVYINNIYKENKQDLITQSYLENHSNKNEVYVVYTRKTTTEQSINKYLTILNNQGFVINNKNIKQLKIHNKIEMYTFDENVSPVLKMLIGITKE